MGEYMKLVKQFLKEGRSQELNIQQARDIFKKSCTQWKPNKEIYRGVRTEKDYVLVTPSQYKRKSVNLANYYTLFLDEISERWDAFPKRSKSLICTTSYKIAYEYGKVYNVIPFDDAKIGVCPKKDIWYSFKDGFAGNELNNLDNLVHFLDVMYYDIDKTEELEQEDPKLFKEQLLKIEQFIKSKTYEELVYLDKTYLSWKKLTNDIKKQGIIRTLEQCLDPDTNDFGVTSFKEYKQPTNLKESFELWTDSDCLLIKQELYDSFIKEITGR